MRIKIISITRLRSNLSDILNATNKKQPIHIISRRGKPECAIVDLEKLEELLSVSDPQHLKDIATAREQVKKGEVAEMRDFFVSSIKA